MSANQPKNRSYTRGKWPRAIAMAAIIAILDVTVLGLGLSDVLIKSLNIGWSVGSVGIITFFGTLMLTNYLSESPDFDKGEVRKAIAISFVIVYFTLISVLAFTDFGTRNEDLTRTMIANMSYIIGLIILFYFGSSTVRDYLRRREEQARPRSDNQQPPTPPNSPGSNS